METEVWRDPIRGTSPIDYVNKINILMSIVGLRRHLTPRSKLRSKLLIMLHNMTPLMDLTRNI